MKGWAGALGGLLAMSAAVHAQRREALQFEVRAADQTCTSARALRARVIERLGDTASSASLHVAVEITAQGESHRARVTLREANGETLGRREIVETGACSALDEPLTLVIASGIGVASPHVAPAAPPPQPAAPPSPSPASPTALPAEPRPLPREPEPQWPRFVSTPPSRKPVRPERWLVDLGVSVRVLTGLLPEASAGGGLALVAGHGSWALAASATWLLPVTLRLDSELALHVTGAAAELSGCRRLAHGAISSLWLCAGVQGGALRTAAPQLWRYQPRWDGLVQLVPSALGRFAFAGRFGLSLRCAAAIPLIFPRYGYVDPRGALASYHQVEPGVWLELGLWTQIN